MHRELRKADRLLDSGEALAARDMLLELDLADERAESRIFARRLRTRARLSATAYEAGRDGTSGTPVGAAGMSVDFAMREVASEVAANARITSRRAATLLDEAFRFVTRFDATVCALEDGEITKPHAATILEHGSPIDDDAKRAEFERCMLDAAQSKTAGQLDAFAKRIVQQFLTRSLDERHEEARRKRYVAVQHVDDGMAYLTAFIPSLDAALIHSRLTGVAKKQKQATAMAITAARDRGDIDEAQSIAADAATMDQLRADILAALVVTTDPASGGNPFGMLASVNANIDVTVSTNALLEQLEGRSMRDTGAFALMNGRIPIPISTAREFLSTCTTFNRVQTDPFTGMIESVETRFANTRMRDFLRIRDAHCRWPGCSLPSVRCELDHTIAVEDGGPTCLSNLGFLCKGHHLLKHQTRWLAEQQGGGVMQWTSPTGRVFTTSPEPADPDFLFGRPPDARPPGEDSALLAHAGPPEFRPSDDDPPPF